jgi:dTDP-4-dehydrorhamnose reductase
MKLLVVGASGLVGGSIHHAAASLGHESTGTYASQALPGLHSLRVEDDAAVGRLLEEIRPDIVFYCSGWTWVDGCESDQERALRENAEQPAQIAQIAADGGAHFVYFSTSYVFDGTDGPYDETAASRPLSVYGRTKLEGEMRVTQATAGRCIIARTMGVYGPEPKQKNFVYQVRKALEAGRQLRVPNDQFGNATYAPDLARIAITLAAQKQSGIWNVAGPDPRVCRSDLARLIARSYGLSDALIEEVATHELGQPAPRPVEGGLIIDKAVRATGITPQPWVKIP